MIFRALNFVSGRPTGVAYTYSELSGVATLQRNLEADASWLIRLRMIGYMKYFVLTCFASIGPTRRLTLCF